MTPEEASTLMEQAALSGQVGQAAQASAAAQYFVEEQEKSLAETQLEVQTIIRTIYHLLKQDILRPNKDKDGELDWFPIEDTKQKALTDWGVDRIMQVVNFYINKNILLSNFDEKQINRIMLRFCIELNDLILLKYQLLFRDPSFEECKEILQDRLDEKKKLRSFTMEILGKKVTREDEEIMEREILSEIEDRIESEIQKIKEEQRKEKLREYGLLMAQLEAIIYATYNRAWKGEERGSIRRHTNISEVLGTKPLVSNANSGGIFKWIKR